MVKLKFARTDGDLTPGDFAAEVVEGCLVLPKRVYFAVESSDLEEFLEELQSPSSRRNIAETLGWTEEQVLRASSVLQVEVSCA